MVLLDSVGRSSRFADAQRIRDWLKATQAHAQTSTDPAVRSSF
jgi:hypothetical protein